MAILSTHSQNQIHDCMYGQFSSALFILMISKWRRFYYGKLRRHEKGWSLYLQKLRPGTSSYKGLFLWIRFSGSVQCSFTVLRRRHGEKIIPPGFQDRPVAISKTSVIQIPHPPITPGHGRLPMGRAEVNAYNNLCYVLLNQRRLDEAMNACTGPTAMEIRNPLVFMLCLP